MKRLIFISLIIVLIASAIVIASNTPQKGSNSTQLSTRSKEFLQKQKNAGSTEYSGIHDSDKNAAPVSSEIVAQGCYALTVPFQIQDTKELDTCFHQITLSSPRAMINVYVRDVSFATLADDPGVRLRRQDATLYKEEKGTVNGRTYTMFKKTDAGYEKTALYLSGGKLFSLNLLANISDASLDSKFSELLKSVELGK